MRVILATVACRQVLVYGEDLSHFVVTPDSIVALRKGFGANQECMDDSELEDMCSATEATRRR